MVLCDMCETQGSSCSTPTVKVTDNCLWCGSAIDPASKRYNTCSNACHLSMQNWSAGVRLALREKRCKLMSMAQFVELSTPVVTTPVVVPTAPVAVVESSKPAKPGKALHCDECGNTGVPLITVSGGQNVAHCQFCEAFIKNVPKTSRQRSQEKVANQQQPVLA